MDGPLSGPPSQKSMFADIYAADFVTICVFPATLFGISENLMHQETKTAKKP